MGEDHSALGSFSYEVADTKLKRRADPKHVLQLVLYSDLLAEIQGVVPEFAHVELGDGTRATLRLADYSSYARMARQRLEAFVADPQQTRPVPCADCSLCRWADHCESVGQVEDSLFNVANISRGQVKKLEAAGVHTLEALARQGADLGLPGWPLLAALLRQPDAEPIKLIRPFGAVTKDHFQDAVAHMNALADLAERGDAAAHVVYDLAFRAVCAWSTETMHDLFHETRVPTEAGTWRLGREVAGLAAGLAQSHMLLERLGKQMPKSKSRETEADHDGRTAAVSTHPPSEVARIEANAAESLRILLAYAKSEVLADLLILLVGLAHSKIVWGD